MMKKSLIFAMAMAMGVTASAYAANPFSDVPAGHWAYDSIEKLAAAGVIDGYGDGTFGGDKLMTRYEMAQIVARAMANGANVDKLAAEFADELDALGVRVANLEKKADAVKIAGEIRAHYADIKRKTTMPGYGGVSMLMKDSGSDSALRTRIWFKGQVNDDWSYTGMVQNIQDFAHSNTGDERVDFQRAYVEGRLGGVDVQAGRIDTTDITGGNIYDTRFDGVKLTYGKEIKVIGRIGKATDAFENMLAGGGDTYSIEAAAKLGKAGDVHGGWWKFQDLDLIDVGELPDGSGWTVGVNLNMAEDLELTADYIKADMDQIEELIGGDKGYVIGLNYKGAKANKPGTWGLHAKYYHQGALTYVAHTMNGAHDFSFNMPAIGLNNQVFIDGFRGYSLMGYYTVAKNMVAGVEWYDLRSMGEGVMGARAAQSVQTLWSQLVITF